jgi:hypothetical protein
MNEAADWLEEKKITSILNSDKNANNEKVPNTISVKDPAEVMTSATKYKSKNCFS